MALISAKTIITSICLFHITLGFFFVTNPATIADQALVLVIGDAMGLPYARDMDDRSSPLAFLGVILAIIGLCDLVTLSLPEEISLVHHWGMQAPLRLAVSFGLVFYTFVFSPSSPLYNSSSSARGHVSHPASYRQNSSYTGSSWGGEGLKNRIFFTFMFVELVSWFWIWVTLGEERREILQRKARRRNSHSFSQL